MLRAWLRVASRAVTLQVEQSQRLAASQPRVKVIRGSLPPAAPVLRASSPALRDVIDSTRQKPERNDIRSIVDSSASGQSVPSSRTSQHLQPLPARLDPARSDPKERAASPTEADNAQALPSISNVEQPPIKVASGREKPTIDSKSLQEQRAPPPSSVPLPDATGPPVSRPPAVRMQEDKSGPILHSTESSFHASRPTPPSAVPQNEDTVAAPPASSEVDPRLYPTLSETPSRSEPTLLQNDAASVTPLKEPKEEASPQLKSPASDESDQEPVDNLPTIESPPAVTLRPSKVPSSRIGRLLHYGSLFAGMSVGAAGEYVKRQAGGGSGSGSAFLSESNIRRLVDKLSRMRGAALKLGQFMSIQDTHTLPPQLESVLQQVQAQADYMPWWQLDEVMSKELGGSDWVDRFDEFAKVPIASASIGQVHRAKVNGQDVAVKIQFPGIHRSIVSDLDNLSILLRTSALLPRGLYLDNTLKVMRGELADECDYEKEADSGRRMAEFLRDDTFFEVPRVLDELSSKRVLTTQWMSGRPLSQIKDLSQASRDKLGTNVLRLCLLELFKFRLMQTDPNWANFLYDRQRDKLQLIDFGATREYTPEFMDEWYGLLKSVVDGDRDAMARYSRQVGYLTGEENAEMLEAHLRSMELLATPFTQDVYDFGKQSVTDEVRQLIPIMLRHRLTPPPNETYSLNRKLSGSFLLCAKLGSRVRCRDLWDEIVGDYKTQNAL